MSIKIECPSCKQQYSVDESIIGEEVECAACSKVFVATKKAPIKLELPTIDQEKTPVPLHFPPTDEATHHSEYVYPWKKPLPLETEQKDSELNMESDHEKVSKDNHIKDNNVTQELHSTNKSKNEEEKKEGRGGSWLFSVLGVVLFLLYVIITLFAVKVLSHPSFKHIPFLILVLICIAVGVWKYFFSDKEEFEEESVGNNDNKPKESEIRLLKKSADLGDSDAQIKLGRCYFEGRKGVEQSYIEALRWFRKAAEQGNAEAQIMLGCCYENGKGVEKDYSETIKWYRMAAKQGNVEAQFKLAVLYSEKDVNGQANHQEEVKWYRLAAKQGHTQAQLLLGLCFYFGDGVEKNMDEALKWIRLSASQGNKDAKDALRTLGY